MVHRNDDQWISVELAVWAGGVLRAGSGYRSLLDVRDKSYTAIRLPGRLSNADLTVRFECRGTAGPEGWLSYAATIDDHNGAPLGPVGFPLQIWTRPWSVPTVVHLPPLWSGMPVHTLTVRVTDFPDLEPINEGEAP